MTNEMPKQICKSLNAIIIVGVNRSAASETPGPCCPYSLLIISKQNQTWKYGEREDGLAKGRKGNF